MPPFLTYQNLDLEIEADGAGYRAHVINSPVGQVDWMSFTLPFSPQQAAAARTLFTGGRHLRLSTVPTPPLDPKDFGRQLYAAVFAGEIGRCLSRSLEKVGDATGLRLRLRLNNAPDLADLPWEMLYGPSPFDFFALSARTPIVRYLATSLPEEALTATLPLRILVVIANPATPDAPALDVETEWGKLNTALAVLQQQRQVVLERLAAPTLAALRARLRISDDKPAIHLLHFIGHGETNALVFEDEQGAPVFIAAETLGVLLHDHPTLKLAFLNACEGGRSDDRDIFLGVAPELVRRGLPAVIAMKYAVSDRAAIGLAAEFYQALADGYPVDAALAEARKAIYASGQSVEWGTPLLFSRSADNRLFVVDPKTQAKNERPRLDFEPETVLIPAGPFWMGSDDGPENERPRHQVTLAAYRIGKYPVTNGEYLAFVRDQGIAVAPEAGWVLAAVGQEPPPGKQDHPVVGVSWDDAVRYCAWLTEQTGCIYRLPSEAEWEKAARGPAGRRYPWGDDFDPARCNSAAAGVGTTTDVHTYVPQGESSYGCVDMAGNVWEWTNTIWGVERSVARFKYPYAANDGREKAERSTPFRELRICRGGSYQEKAERLTCATRTRQPADGRDVRRGLRVLREV